MGGREEIQLRIDEVLLEEQSRLEKRTGFRVACPEEIAFNQKFIDRDQLGKLGLALGKSDYAKYVQMLAAEALESSS